eukprot:TRINITY_DN3825_c0_g1_i1.p1 TRINITY_DN3825_c0_g1~~TRINITY_DN3825_c0_g1_i1.p1  ORF type:complete len:142 (+),score=51.38 TRINITY_DN3825_c0_g1_i1:81-506(+)
MAQQQRINLHSNKPQVLEIMSKHIAENLKLIQNILSQFINLSITVDGIQWSIAKPLLSLIIICQNEFKMVSQVIVSSQQGDEAKMKKVADAFTTLMSDIGMNLDSDNRDKFSTNVATFKGEMKTSLDMNTFYKAILQFSKD